MAKKLKRRYSDTIDYDLDGMTIKEAVRWLTKKEKELREAYPKASKIELCHDTKEWSDGYELNIVVFSIETDEEETFRENKEREWKETREARERAEFERLSKKYK
jgi:hypothetical protein